MNKCILLGSVCAVDCIRGATTAPNCILMLARSPAVQGKTIDLALMPAHTSHDTAKRGLRCPTSLWNTTAACRALKHQAASLLSVSILKQSPGQQTLLTQAHFEIRSGTLVSVIIIGQKISSVSKDASHLRLLSAPNHHYKHLFHADRFLEILLSFNTYNMLFYSIL